MSPIKYFHIVNNGSTPEKAVANNVRRIIRLYEHHTCLSQAKNQSQMKIILGAILASELVACGIYTPAHAYGKSVFRTPSSLKCCPLLEEFKTFLRTLQPKYLQSSLNFFSKIRYVSVPTIWKAQHAIYKATDQLEKGGISIQPRVKKAVCGFELLSKFTNNIKAPKTLQYDWPTIPQRSTQGSAGYDIRAHETITVPSIPKALLTHKNVEKAMEPTMVKTGLKAYMPKNWVLYIYNRSSNPGKRGLYLANGVGVVDSDYFNNPANEGELLIAFINLGMHNYTIHSGDRIVQGVFSRYHKTDIDMPVARKRKGGFGSTGKK